MSECDKSLKLGAYVDGELSPEACEAMERHLAECAACAAELRELQRMSRMLGQWSAPEPSVEAMRRFHREISRTSFRKLERLAFSLTSLAAGLALAVTLWSGSQPQNTLVATAPWERAAVNPADTAATANNPQDIALAQWVVSDLAAGGVERD